MKRGKRGGWKRGREWGLHWMSVVETHKLPTFKHLHLKGEHIYIYITYPKKIFKSKADMFGWNKTKKHNQNSPINQKIHTEFNFPFFHSEIGLQSVICFATQDGTHCWEKPSLLSLLDPILWEGVGRAVGHGRVNSWLLGRMSDCALHPPELHRTAWCHQCWVKRSRVHKPQRTRTWLQQGARTLCFFMGYISRAKERERRKSPIGKRSWLSPWTEMESKALKPTPGQIEIVSKVFPNQKKRSKSGSDCGHKRRRRTVNAMNWWSFKE